MSRDCAGEMSNETDHRDKMGVLFCLRRKHPEKGAVKCASALLFCIRQQRINLWLKKRGCEGFTSL